MAVRICLLCGSNWDRRREQDDGYNIVRDLNHNELLSTMDVTLVLHMAANNIGIDFAADANLNGAVTQVDAPLIWQSMISKAALA